MGIARAGLSGLVVGQERFDAFQERRMRVDLYDESVVLVKYNDGAPVSAYEVAPDDLAAAFSGVPISTGLLPPDVVFYTRRGSHVRMAIYLEPQIRTLHVEDGDAARDYVIPLPGLVFVGELRRYSIYAAKARPTAEHDRLYHAPFPNVHTKGGICAGDVEFPECAPDTIHEAADLFLDSTFNHDLRDGKSQDYPEDILDLWDELDGEHEALSVDVAYPLDDLRVSRSIHNLIEGAS
jgi:PRTRC genetic system protein B